MPVPRIQDAAALLEQGNPAAAIPMLERLIRLFPTYATAHVLLAEAYEAEGATDRATRAWHAAYFLVPGSPVITEARQRILGFPAPSGDTARRQPVPSRPAPVPEPEEPRYNPDAFLEELDEEVEWADSLEAEPEAEADALPGVPYWQPLGRDEEETDAFADEPAFEEEAWPTFTPEAGEQPPAPVSSPVPPPTSAPPPRPGASPPPAPDAVAPVRLGRSAAPPQKPGPPAPPAPAKPTPPPARPAMETDDLDDLIYRLENAGRIVPKPDFEPPDSFDLEEEDAEDMVSETLARIYEAQRQFTEAANTYERLARQHPEKQQEYLSKAAALRSREGGR